jgi:hypothetical protein
MTHPEPTGASEQPHPTRALNAIQSLLDDARQGRRTEAATLRAISQVIRRSPNPGEVYQKPLG